MSALALTNLRVWDGRAEQVPQELQVLRVEDGRIVALGEDPRLAEGAEQIDLSGAFALPGLIDAHVHLTLDPEVRDPNAQLSIRTDGSKPDVDVLESGMEARVRAMVRAGITTARDLGGKEWRELALRDRIARGELEGPRVLCAGQPVTSPRGHCWFWGGEAEDEQQIREVVRRQADKGVDWIKVMATGGVITKGTDTRQPQFDVAALRALVEEAGEHGRPVAAHCHGTRGIANAARARVRTIEHCSFVGGEGFGSDIDSAVVVEMARAQLWVSPTVNSGWKRMYKEDGEPGKTALRMSEAFDVLRAHGVRLIASTDAGIPGVAHHRLPEALAVFARIAQLSPVQVLRSATSESARALGLERETGVLAPGLAADVLVVEGNPLEDLSALLRPKLVLARGRRIDLAA